MTKKTYTDPHIQIRIDVVLNLSRANLKRDQLRFLMVLMRETFGRKNQKTAGTARGKYMPWEPSTWVENGFHKVTASRVKRELLSLRVIRTFNKNNIGFNWHFDQWKTDWYRDFAVNSAVHSNGESKLSSSQQSKLSSSQELTQQFTEVNSAVHSTPPKPVTDTDLQTLKKGKKGKIIYTEEFEEFWKKYPKGKGKKDAMVAYEKHVIKEGNITSPELVALLEKARPEMLAKIAKDGKDEFIKQASSWINSQPWDDEPTGDSPQGQSLKEQFPEPSRRERLNTHVFWKVQITGQDAGYIMEVFDANPNITDGELGEMIKQAKANYYEPPWDKGVTIK